MEALAKSDIFFVIASIGTILFIVIVAVLGMYGIKIARDVRHISERTREEIDAVSSDLREFRHSLREKSGGIRSLLRFLIGVGTARRRTKRRKTDEDV